MDLSIKLIVFLPLLAAIVAGLFGRYMGKVPAKVITTGALFIACGLSWPIFIGFMTGANESTLVPVLDWINSGDMQIDWALRVDALTAVMLVVVTSVSSLVHLYSWGYMEEDPSQPRFFAYLSLFTFAMLMLVTADSLVQMFFGWEGVGLASYLLIGFWYHKPSANAAAIKAFVVNRVGDFGFSLGIFACFLVFNTVSIPVILEAAPAVAGTSIGFAGMNVDTLTLICILLFIGAMGKSAQLGLHTWLPDAMEGPTPVSALIHAATMVTAGVFMVCRLSPLFELSPVALSLVTYIGAATAIFAATVALVQTDIKRVIAYSTCSQLGYMFFAAGVGAYGAAMFHLFTHAFFKALLFLGAGSVIHAMHHEQDMRYYGALRKEIPITFWAMMLGTLAITGVGIPGTYFGFAGFFSKDAIIESAYAAAFSFDVGMRAAGIAFVISLLAALLTSFYSWRLIFLTFFGKARWGASEHVAHASHDAHHDAPAHEENVDSEDVDLNTEVPVGTGGYHPHESPWSMLVPLILLSVGAVAAGYAFYYPFFGVEEGAEFWAGSLVHDAGLVDAAHHVPYIVKWSPAIVMLIGLFLAWTNYIRKPGTAGKWVAATGGTKTFLQKKWYFDELYDAIFVKPSLAIGRFFWKRGDVGTIDRFGPHGAGKAVAFGNKLTAKLQSGYLNSYALVMLLGLIAAASWAFWWASR